MESTSHKQAIKLGNRPRSGQATQELLRYIQSHQLKAGDRLPAQSELRRELQFSNDSLTTAMNTLTRSGVLVRKPGLGTVVLDPAKQVMGLWRVGVALLPAIAAQAYYGQLLLYLQTYLSISGCTTTLYMLNHGEQASNPDLKKYGYLVDDLTDGRLHGVMIMSSLPKKQWQTWWNKGVPILHVGPWEAATAGVVIAQKNWVHNAVRLMARRQCRRLAVVSMWGANDHYCQFWKGFEAGLSELGRKADPNKDSLFGGEGSLGGAHVARQLLSLPPAERPDGLIVVDDRVALGLTVLLSEQKEYRPTIMVQTNQQAPQSFALPVIQISLDVDEFARYAVERLIEYMRNADLPPRVSWVEPRMRSEDAVQFAFTEADKSISAAG